MGASTASGGGSSKNNNKASGSTYSSFSSNMKEKAKAKQGAAYVKDQLGIVPQIANPNQPVTDANTVGFFSNKGKSMYGADASQAASDFIAQQDPSAGYYVTDSKGNMLKDSKGNPVLSGKGAKLKYGQGGSGAAMGTGDPTGIMPSVPLSSQMLKSQNKFNAALTGGMAALSFMAGIPLAPTVLASKTGKLVKDVKEPGAAFRDYTQNFVATQKGEKYKSKRSAVNFMSDLINNPISTSATLLGGGKKQSLGGD